MQSVLNFLLSLRHTFIVDVPYSDEDFWQVRDNIDTELSLQYT
ncbi:MAG: hypothetical protein V7K38_09360 [Nostoc sp.]